MGAQESGNRSTSTIIRTHDAPLQTDDDNDGIAIIGMSCRFPGAKKLDEFWHNLRNGVESITFFSDKELLDAGENPADLADPSYVKAGAVIDNIDLFDCRFFGYSTKEAELIDPQQRIFLECTWECFEDAGYIPNKYDGRIGVFGGTRISTYLQYLLSQFNRFGTASSFQTLIGNDKDYLANRVSYKLNLKGPSVTVQTACSTSLVAVHMAAESLYNGECDMALAGGVAVSVPQKQGYFYQEDMIFSPDGHCRPFDASAQGIIGGNGAGVVLLKPLCKALEDRDNIYAVIKGSAVNNDGNTKAGYTAPSIEGQTTVISEALTLSGASPESISYIETHGTGTPLGDPIELEALSRVYKDVPSESRCAIGSVKSNMGHLDTAAGIASLIKTALALKHKQIPPSLHFQKPNPRIDFQNTGFYVNTTLSEWTRNGHPRRAGVSSFGIGGTNAHAIVEEGPKKHDGATCNDRTFELIPISGKTEQAVKDYAAKYKDYFEENPDGLIADVAYSASVGRVHFSHRIALCVKSIADGYQVLDRFLGDGPSEVINQEMNHSDAQRVAFLFTGQGAQYPLMGQALYETELVFKESIDACAAVLDPLMETSLVDLLFHEELQDENESKLHQTRYTQPALFSMEYALAQMWQSWGVQPSAVMGHSVGEYVAAVIAGIFNLEQGLKLIEARGRLMQQLPQNGAMVAVFAEEAELQAVVKEAGDEVSIAAYNGPRLHVVSGLTSKIDRLSDVLKDKGLQVQRLTVSHAFHSPLMLPMMDAFSKVAQSVSYHPPKIDIVLNADGKLSRGEEAANPDYWCRHVVSPVRFSDGMQTLFENGYRLFLEVGPHPVLSGMGRRCLPDGEGIFVPSLAKATDPWRSVTNALGTLYTQSDANIDWDNYYAGRDTRRVSLPTYPFQKRRVWVTPQEEQEAPSSFDRGRLAENIRGVVQSYSGGQKSDVSDSGDEKVDALLTKLSVHYIARALKSIGAFEDPEERFSVESFLFQTPLLPRYRQLMSCFLEGLAKEGFLEKEDDEYFALQDIGKDELSAVVEQLRESTLFAEKENILNSICAYGETLADLLSGVDENENTGLQGDLVSICAFIYRDCYSARYYNGFIGEVLDRISQVVPNTNKIRILEVGGGTGELTKSILGRLEPARTEYHFTDLSPFVVEVAQEHMTDGSYVKYGVLDIQQDCDSQGFDAHQYDIIVAGNVLHSTRDIEESLRNIQLLLAPGGVLIVREAAEHRLFQDLLLGALDQEIEDEALREENVYLSAEAWQTVLSQTGFDSVVSPLESESAGEYVMVAMSEGSTGAEADAAFSESALPNSGTETAPGPSAKTAPLEALGSFYGRRLNTALPVYELLLRPSQQELLSSYTIFGNSVAPVSQYCDIAHFIAAELLSAAEVSIIDFRIDEPLVFTESDKEIKVQVVCTRKRTDAVSFEVFSEVATGDGNDSEWLSHFSCRATSDVTANSADNIKPLLAKDFTVGQSVKLTGEDIFGGFKRRGIEYGNGLKRIEEVAVNDRELACRIAGLEENLDEHRAASILAEACIQSAVTLLSSVSQESDSLYFPTQIGAMTFSRRAQGAALIQATLNQKGEKSDGGSVSCLILDDQGEVLGTLQEIALARFDSRDIERSFQASAKRKNAQTGAARSQGTSQTIQAIRESDGVERIAFLETYLIETFSGILHMDKEEIAPEDDFIQLGLDSLQFLELNQVLTRELNLKVSARDAYESPYISALAERLAAAFSKTTDSDESPPFIMDPVTAIGGEISSDIENLYKPFPLTNVQYAYWIGRSGILDLGNVSCHFYFEVERPHLDLDLFNAAWNKVIARHDMLRSVILKEGAQQILPNVPFYEVTQYDFRHHNDADAEQELKKIRHEKSHQVISSDEWPLFDICVSWLPDGTARMHFSIELLNADVMSIQIIFTELDAFMKEPAYEPAPLAISFRDYVLAENRLRQTEFYNVSKNYWLEQIPQMPPAPELPTMKDLQDVANQRFTSLVFEMDKDAWASLKAQTAKRGLTPSGVLLTAYADILAAWSKNKSFIISLAQFNRVPFHPDVFNITGDFTSILIMAMNARSADRFEKRAKIAQADLWTHLEHRYFDGVEVIREMARGRRMGNEALIPVVFTSILGVGEQSEELYPWAVLGEVGYFVSQTPQVWLDNQVSERDGQLIVSWDVIEEIFPEGMLDDMLSAYKILLHRLAYEEDAWTALGTDFVPDHQLKIFAENNATRGPVSTETLHQLFLSNVEERRSHPALVTSQRTFTYDDLYTLSNNIAHLLRESGARPNTLVAVVMVKGWQQVAAVLGILMSGAAYLPVSADLPQERIKRLLADGDVSIVLCQKEYDGKIQWPQYIRHCYYIDALNLGADHRPMISSNTGPSDIAYVIYTSGSTGMPKGVIIDHQGAVNTIRDINRRFLVDKTDKVLGISELNFDLSVYDIFGTLAAGGTIVLPDAERRKEPAHWWELIKSENITVWNSVPLLMQMLLEYNYADKASPAQTLRLVLLSGDWIPLNLAKDIKDVFTDARTISLGGATEASIWSIIFPIEDVSPKWRSIPYGKPMMNQQFHVLDDDYNYCPTLVPGRLYIGGIGLAKGYWRDDEKTKERFVVHPKSGERLYHTGDLGRYLADGNIEFLGREDNQVKIRGYRIELGEIEATLREHDGIKEAAVTVVEEDQNEKRLCAHVVLHKRGDNELHQIVEAREDSVDLWETIRRVGVVEAERVGPELSPETFPLFWRYLETLTAVVMCEALMSMEILHEQNTGRTLPDIFRANGVDSRFENLLMQWFRFLARQQVLSLNNDVFATLEELPLKLSDSSLTAEIEAYPAWKHHGEALLAYFQDAVSKYVSILKGTLDPLELLLSDGALFSAESMEHFNPVRHYNRNILISMIENYSQKHDRKEKLRVLELGTRAEPITAEILSRLPNQFSYTYTDEAAFLLEKAKEELGDGVSIDYALFNINEPPDRQNPDLWEHDIIIAANTLHRAHHISRSLEYIRSMMAPGGVLLLLEGTRNSAMQLITVGLLENGFNQFEDERRERCLPLLSADRWVDALLEGGFEKVEVYPSPKTAAEVFGQSVIAARAPRQVTRFDSTALKGFVQKMLPEYMWPGSYMRRDAMPLSANGKIDRNALQQSSAKKTAPKNVTTVAPETPTQIAIAGMWQKVLKISEVGLYDEFITLGGDSLQATQLINELRETFNADIPLRILFEDATVHKLAQYIESIVPNENEFEEGTL